MILHGPTKVFRIFRHGPLTYFKLASKPLGKKSSYLAGQKNIGAMVPGIGLAKALSICWFARANTWYRFLNCMVMS